MTDSEQNIRQALEIGDSNQAAINAIYEQSLLRTAETGIVHTVDHIIPLVSKVVCGLHVESNLQVIPFRDNCKKNNKFDPLTWGAAAQEPQRSKT